MSKTYDNAIVHLYTESPYVAKCSVNLRRGEKIVLHVVLRDQYAAAQYLSAHGYPRTKTIVHH